MAANTMATIEPRLMHLLNVNDDRDQLPSIHSTLGTSNSPEDDAALLLPPLELNSPETTLSTGKQQQSQHQQTDQGHVSIGSAFSTLAGDDGPSLTSSGAAAVAGWPTRPLQILRNDAPASNAIDSSILSGGLDDTLSSTSSHLMGKRPHVVLPHTDELMQLPQPLKKQKSNQQVGSLNQVFPPIINGLHEPPPNAAVFPPIAYTEYDNEESLERGTLATDYGHNTAGLGGGHGGGGSIGHYLFDNMLAGPVSSSILDFDRIGDASSLSAPMPHFGGSQHPHSLHMPEPSPSQGPGTNKSSTPARSTKSATAEEADSLEEPSSSTTSTKAKRRATKPRRRWTEEETNQLLIGVSRHGLGKWTAILEDREFSFSSRTAGDLKDRFRTCCPEELRGKLSRSDQSIAGSPPDTTSPVSSAAGPSSSGTGRLKTKTSLSLEDILTETDEQSESFSGSQGQDDASGSAASPDQPKMRKRRVHRRNMEDMVKLGIQGPFKQSHRRERRPFTEQDDREILEGLQIYGPAWTKIHRHAGFNLSSRQPTDLRDRVRNKYPDIYANIEKGVYQSKTDSG